MRGCLQAEINKKVIILVLTSNLRPVFEEGLLTNSPQIIYPSLVAAVSLRNREEEGLSVESNVISFIVRSRKF